MKLVWGKYYLWFILLVLIIATNSLIILDDFGVRPFIFWVTSLMLLVYLQRPVVNIKIKNFDWILWLFVGIYIARFKLLQYPEALFFHGDEAILSQNAFTAFQSGLQKNQWQLLGKISGPVSYFPGLWYYLQGATIHILGPSLASIKTLSLITDLGICLLLYQLVKRWCDKVTAVISGVVYATFPIMIHFSMTGLQNIESTFFLMGSVYCIEKFRSAKQIRWLTIAGMVSGVGMYFYLSSLLIPIFGVVAIIITSKKFTATCHNCLRYLVSFVMAAGPFLLFNFLNYNFLVGRSRAYQIWDSTNVFKQLLSHLFKVIRGFYPGPMNGSGEFYIHDAVITSGVMLLLLLVGIVILLKRLRRDKAFQIIAWVVAGSILTGGILTDNPPTPHRILHVFPFLALAVGLAISHLATWSLKFFNDQLVSLVIMVATTIVVISGNMAAYLYENIPIYLTKPKSYTAYQATQYLQQQNIQLPLYTQIPSHMNSQIYFYSHGNINPTILTPTVREKLLTQPSKPASFLYLTHKAGLKLLDNPRLSRQQISFSNADMLYLFIITIR
jgi:hypothetical protein